MRCSLVHRYQIQETLNANEISNSFIDAQGNLVLDGVEEMVVA